MKARPSTLVACGCLAAAVFMLSCASCGEGAAAQPSPKGDGDVVAVAGSIGGLLPSASGRGTGEPRSIASAVSHIGAYPVVAGDVGIDSVDEGEVTPPDEQGAFSFEFVRTDGEGYVLVLLDETASEFEQVVGFVTIPAGEEESLLALPIEDAVADIDLGELVMLEDEAQAAMDLTTLDGYFELSVDQLIERALMDDVGRSIKNYLYNYDPVTGEHWNLQRHTGLYEPISAGNGQFSPSDSRLDDEVMNQMNIHVRDPLGPGVAEFESGASVLEVFPSEEIEHPKIDSEDPWELATYGPEAPFTTVVPERWEWYWEEESGYKLCLQPEQVAPEWTITVDGEASAVFDVSFFDPFDADGNYLFYRPSARFTFSEENLLERIELRFYYYDRSVGEYTEVSDYTGFDAIARFSVGVNGQKPGPEGEHVAEDIDGRLEIDSFEYDWYLSPPDTSVHALWFIRVGTWVGDSPFVFYFQAP